ncbi:MAG: 30S ribosomal protein S12 methylthiotransferase RimO [Oscillospiraceae bacterium]|nr:30S ribosomal protein S12 methylthiotransferase RimO [Oscillospiraceae bacterium]
MKVCVIALGCEKNVINSEQMLHLLVAAGFEIAADPGEADLTVVNTCGFIEDARREAIEQILDVSRFPCKIIVAGCMAERHKDEILREMPEVSGLVGAGRFDDIVQAVHDVMSGKKPEYFGSLDAPVSEVARAVTSPQFYAFLKIADGCSNHCSYCAIPDMRGPYRSRPMENILSEARTLCRAGAKELILIAQDTTLWGYDLYGKRRLPELLQKLCETEGLCWIRIHYLYPDAFTDELIGVLAREEKIVKYLDIPIQHISGNVLSAMNRREDGEYIRRLVDKLRAEIPGLVLRTSLIAGFPGETHDDFEELCCFLEQYQIPRVGVFAYSREDGTPAASFAGQIEESEKRSRVERIEMIQSLVMDSFNHNRIGKAYTVMCEENDTVNGYYSGRSYAESPGADGKIFFKSSRPISPGEMVEVYIKGCFEGDVFGEAWF